jgi:energy-coupling factor transporter ATP-binding protein EcfA2
MQNRVRTIDVFTPTTPAKFTFVERKLLASQLMNALRTPGKQVVVYGQTGSGKTTLLTNKLAEIYGTKVVTSRCTVATTFENLLLSAFDELNVYYASGASVKSSSSITAKLEQEYFGIKGSIEGKQTQESGVTYSRTLPPQLTPQRLAQFCGAAECCWLLEDFHKVPAFEKKRLSQIMKVFMDSAAEYPLVKIIAIGAVDTARQVIEYDPDMRNRVAEISVPTMTQEELFSILRKGEELLNVNFGKHKQDIASYSSGLGAVCHQLALNICFAASIEETCKKETWIQNEEFAKALETYITDASDTLKAVFDLATKQKKKGQFDNTRLILKALATVGREGAVHSAILAHVRKAHPEYPAGNVTNYLKELQTAKRGQVVRWDPVSGKYYFADPLYFAYAQCLLVPPQQSKLQAISLLGHHFYVDNSHLAKWVITGTISKKFEIQEADPEASEKL